MTTILFWCVVVLVVLAALTGGSQARAEKRMHDWMTEFRRQHRGASYDQCYRAWLNR